MHYGAPARPAGVEKLRGYSLLETSPAVAGGVTGLGITVDFNGNPRDIRPDSGAFEFQFPPPTPVFRPGRVWIPWVSYPQSFDRAWLRSF